MTDNASQHITIIEPKTGWIPIDFKEIWKYRELFYFLTKRDIKVRYKQTVLGGLWAIIQPFFTMVVFSIFLADWQSFLQMGFPIRFSYMPDFYHGHTSQIL
jgi:lipopolysaccharide transport system permease protein